MQINQGHVILYNYYETPLSSINIDHVLKNGRKSENETQKECSHLGHDYYIIAQK